MSFVRWPALMRAFAIVAATLRAPLNSLGKPKFEHEPPAPVRKKPRKRARLPRLVRDGYGGMRRTCVKYPANGHRP